MLSSGPERFPTLFSPLQVGPMTVPNRIVCAPHQTEFSPDAWHTDEHVAYLERRAVGGAGWVVTEPVEAHPSARRELPPGRGAWEPGAVDAWRRLVGAVQRHGTRITLTIGHAGPNTTSAESGQALWGPSEEPSPAAREVPAVMTPGMIADLVASIGTVAANAAAAGFDGVELQVTADYLFGAFLSPLTNRRSDAYGGTLAGRGRAVAEALAAMRAGAGPGLAVGLRISADHLVPGALRPDESAAFLAGQSGAGAIDYVSVIQGTYHTLDHIIPTMGSPVAPVADAARTVRQAVGLPVAMAGRIPDPALMEQLLASGTADLIATARLFIADPDWVAKVQRGDDALVRRCLYCNQLCVTQLAKRKPIRCVQNPDVGREVWGRDGPPRRSLRVLVVGGGPAGLESACTLSGRGHDVTVVERAGEPGGRLRLASGIPGRAELEHALAPRLELLARRGLTVRYGTDADRALVEDLAPDVVVQATGAVPYRDPAYRGRPGQAAIDGLVAADVLTIDDVAADPPQARRVLVVDEEGTRAVSALVAWLVDRDCEVVVVTTLPHLGHPTLVQTQEWATTVPPLLRRGVVVHPFARLAAVRGGEARVVPTDGGASVCVPGVEAVLLAMGGTVPPGPDLGRPVMRIGDCLAPRDLAGALHDGRLVARALGTS